MNAKDAADYLGRNEKTLRRWIKSGRLPAKKISGPHGDEYNIALADLETLKGAKENHPEVIHQDRADTNGTFSLDTEHETGQQEENPSQETALSFPAHSGQDTADILKALVEAIREPKTGHLESLSLDAAPELMTVVQAGQVLQMSQPRVRTLLKTGELRGLKGYARGWRVKKEDLRKFVEEL